MCPVSAAETRPPAILRHAMIVSSEFSDLCEKLVLAAVEPGVGSKSDVSMQ